jgi:hypothetical protein
MQQNRQLGDIGRNPSRLIARKHWSQRRSSFFNDRYAAARPITAPFIFESETAGLTFFQHRCPQSW